MRRALAASAVLVLAVLGVGGDASAASVLASGWWTRSPAASAPEGGVTVSNAPDGPVSVAAVRLDLGTTGVSSATLRLEQTGGAAPAGASLVTCVVGDGWTPIAAGPIEEAPATTCDGTSTALTLNGTTWTANVADLVGEQTGSVSMAIVPTTGSGEVFDLQFDKPAFQGTPASPPTTRATATTTAPSRTTATTMRSSPSFAAPRPPAARVTTTTVAVTPTVIDNSIPNISAEDQIALAVGSDEGESEGRPVGQAITFIVLAAIVGLVGGVGHRVVTERLAA